MESQLKVFNSLNCSKCGLPFSKNANDRKVPRKFPTCGMIVCTQCFEDIKRQRQEENHGCVTHKGCYFGEVKPVYFLIELLNTPAIVESPDGNGYCLTEPLDIPECAICQEEYSIEIEDRRPYELTCNHVICIGCVKNIRRHIDGSSLPLKTLPLDYFSITCPSCLVKSQHFHLQQPWKTNSLRAFLEELPEMIKQIETAKGRVLKSRKVEQVKQVTDQSTQTGESSHTDQSTQINQEKQERTAKTFSPTIEITDHFDCPECVRKFPIEDMFLCSDCRKKICGICATRQHREHKLTDLLVKETSRISEETRGMVLMQINGYKRIFPGLHQQLIERMADFENVLSEKAEGIAKLESFEKTKNEFENCKDYSDRFEQISQDYLPNLRSFDTNLQNLIDELQEAKISEMETGKK